MFRILEVVKINRRYEMENNKISNISKLQILLVLALAVLLTLGFMMTKGTSIILHLDESVEEIETSARTVEEFLEEQKLVLDKKGYINVSLDRALNDNLHIILKQPKTYTISLADAEWEVRSIYSTVESILTDSGVNFTAKDYSSPDFKTQISDGEKITLSRVHEERKVVEEKIPFEKIVKKNPKLEIGNSNTVQEGVEGVKQIESIDRYVNGEFVKNEIVEERIISKPVSQIVEKGTRDRIRTSRGDTNYRKSMVMNATAYDLSFASCGKRPGDRGYGITASGTQARPGAVAVDPKVIPLGTKLYIESLDDTPDYGFATAEDTGGAIKGKKIDLFFHSGTDVKNFGRRNVKVYILK